MRYLAEADVRAIVRLLGGTASINGDHNIKKQFLMRGLCQLVDVDTWVWTLGCQIKPNEPQVYVGFVHEGFTDERFAKFIKAVEHKDMTFIANRFAENLRERNQITTMTREEIDTTNQAARSSAGELWNAADIGSLILSGFPLDEESISLIGLYRRHGDRPFSQREKNIVHIILSEVPWLHLSGWPEDRGVNVPHLSPRQRVTLNLLLEGLSRKEISTHMDISETTVSTYIKQIYTHFQVNSQAQLMRKFLFYSE